MNPGLRRLPFPGSLLATMDLPQTLKAWRNRERLTQRQAAERLGRSYKTYLKWEQGLSRPDAWSLEKLLEKVEAWQDFSEVA